MKTHSRLAFVACSIFFASPLCLAQDTDQLWNKAQAHNQSLKHLVPRNVQTANQSYDGQNQLHNSTEVIEVFKGFDDQHPVRAARLITHNNPIHPSQQISALFPNPVLEGAEFGLPATRHHQPVGQTTIDGSVCRIFAFDGNDDGMEFIGRAWVDQTSGMLRKVEYRLQTRPGQLIRAGSFATDYDAQGRPVQARSDFTIAGTAAPVRHLAQHQWDEWAVLENARPTTQVATVR
ncbi:MAG: hypothetical protein RL748_2873 [Pseudomonadota bacterium]|jgi:hypothetical protein